ncbi:MULTISPECIES: hypothetical protein [Nocardia]|uniref:hypothetical protein n=1 Tax=Nocardia TaxID=1817 RepID=UPI001893415B|nr:MULTISPECIES: hypothetical protein [Nocardia]MBF6351753.1 hypothetical protein [Nocardia flavorosea]
MSGSPQQREGLVANSSAHPLWPGQAAPPHTDPPARRLGPVIASGEGFPQQWRLLREA